VKRAIGALAADPRVSDSKVLNVPDVEAEVRRLRIKQWRIIYAVTEAEHAVDVLAVRKRPPYDYGDLGELIAEALPPEP
jgi:mRNA interferase RelE/StbE